MNLTEIFRIETENELWHFISKSMTYDETVSLWQSLVKNLEKAEKWDKKIQFWQDEGLTLEEAERFANDVDKADISVTHEVYEENKQLKKDNLILCKDAIPARVDDIVRLSKENKQLKDKFQLLLKHTGRDVVATIQYVNELKEEQDDYLKQIQKWKRLYLIDKGIMEKIREFVRQQTVLELDGYDNIEEANEAGTNDAWWLLILKELLAETKEGNVKHD